MRVLPKFSQTDENQASKIHQKLLRRYAVLGSTVFGPVPKGHERQFFCLDKYAWVWYEAWTDNNGQHQAVTTRYEVRPNGIFKTQNGSGYMSLSDNETNNLLRAAQIYLQKVTEDYHRALAAA